MPLNASFAPESSGVVFTTSRYLVSAAERSPASSASAASAFSLAVWSGVRFADEALTGAFFVTEIFAAADRAGDVWFFALRVAVFRAFEFLETDLRGASFFGASLPKSLLLLPRSCAEPSEVTKAMRTIENNSRYINTSYGPSSCHFVTRRKPNSLSRVDAGTSGRLVLVIAASPEDLLNAEPPRIIYRGSFDSFTVPPLPG